MELPLPIKNKIVYFSTSAQVVRRWGRESVSDPIVALLELIKNAYDADAVSCNISFENLLNKEGCKIVISDTGSGMNESEILNKWLRAATNDKSVNKFTKKYKRRKIGEKGIGRFSTERLARRVTLISYPKKNEVGHILKIDWREYDNPDMDFEKIPLKLEYFKKNKKDHGLKIVLEDLDDIWGGEEIEKLYHEISLILPPGNKKGKFGVKIDAKEFPKYGGKIKSSFLKDADFILNAKLSNDGSVIYTIKQKGRKPIKKQDKLGKVLSGPIEFQLFFFYLGKTIALRKSENETIDFTLRKKIMNQFSGIKLYRDGFRVKPFGDKGNDWLGLNQERVNYPSLYPGNNQMFGVAKISKDANPNIEDTTSRENIISNLAWNDLKRFVKSSIKYFSLERQKLERKYKGRTLKKRKEISIKEAFKKESEKVSKEIEKKQEIISTIPTIPQDIIDSCPNIIKKLLEEFNGCLIYGYFNASAILARKILDNSTILKLRKERKENLILKHGEYVELGARIDCLKKERLIDSSLAKKLIKDNKIKIFGDSAAHSYRITIKEEDLGQIRDLLRLCLEQLFSNYD